MVTHRSRSWSIHVLFVLFQSVPLIPEIQQLSQTLTLKIQCQGYVVEVQGHIASAVSNWFCSFLFHNNQTNNLWDTAVSNLTLRNPRSMSWARSKARSHSYIVDKVSNQCTSSKFHVNRTNHSNMWPIKCLTLKKHTGSSEIKHNAPKSFQQNSSKVKSSNIHN